MRKLRVLSLSLITVLGLTLLCSFGLKDAAAADDTAAADTAETPNYWENQTYDTSLTGSEFVEVGRSDKMQLLLNPSTGTIRWLDTATGIYQDTNMANDEGLASKTNAEQSDVIVRYFSGSKNANKLYWNTSQYDSYSMAASRGQLYYQKLDNGVRIVYLLGDDSTTYKNFPPRISDERMQEYVMQYLDVSQQEILKSRYTQLSSGDWIRGFGGGENGAQNRLGTMAMEEIYNIFYVIGKYTDELLQEDLQTWEAKPEDYPSNLKLYVPVEYYLDGDELVVNVDTTMIETEKDNPINSIQMLPYFLNSSATKEAEDGYMFIPDGSGALIYLDSTKTKEYHYRGTYYGGDKLTNAKTYSSVDNKLQLPVFGMKTSEHTIFGVIENGAEIATLDAYISGTDNSEPFCKMGLSFEIQAQQILSSGASNASGAFNLYKATDDVYDENITLRYFWLGRDTGYVQMAQCYADYLEEKGVLTEKAKEEDPPFFVEFLGTTDKTQYLLGIPYDGTQALTTFKQAKQILEDVTSQGVKNVKLIYSGIVNGGINQRSLANKVKFAPGLGGSSDFNALKTYADSIGTMIYPNLLLQTANTKAKLSNELVAWNIINEKAQIYKFDHIKHQIDEDNEFPLYIINPNALASYLLKAKASYTSQLGLNNIASEDLYTFIGTNYGEGQVSPSTGADKLKEAVSQFADGMSLMLSNPIVDAYEYSDYIMDVPVEHSGMRVLDASVPFMGMVLDGHLQYSAESSNRESTDVFLNIMHAIESNAQPKFTLMYENSSLLTGTEQEHYFAVDYSYWKDQIGFYYNEYRNFYDKTKDAKIVDHEIVDRNDKLRVVTYSNGVKAYFNYSDLDETLDGVTVPAFSYLVQ